MKRAAMVSRMRLGAGALLLLALAGAAGAQELVFATVEEGRRVLGTRDDYVAHQSPFDRAVRMRSDRAPSERAYLDFVAAAARPWTAPERATVEAAWRSVLPGAQQLGLPVPPRVLVVKSSGHEEGNAPHTRADAIVLPAGVLGEPAALMRHVLAHELFHVVSRANPSLAAPLYAAIGFRYCGEIDLPAPLAPLRITNPDAPRNDYCVSVRVDNQPAWVVPILYSRTPYDRARGGDLFNYLQLGFLRVTRPADGRTPWPVQNPTPLALESLAGFFEQVGKNTQEVIHPEEIVAENVARLVTGDRVVPSPDVLARIETALREAVKR